MARSAISGCRTATPTPMTNAAAPIAAPYLMSPSLEAPRGGDITDVPRISESASAIHSAPPWNPRCAKRRAASCKRRDSSKRRAPSRSNRVTDGGSTSKAITNERPVKPREEREAVPEDQCVMEECLQPAACAPVVDEFVMADAGDGEDRE